MGRKAITKVEQNNNQGEQCTTRLQPAWTADRKRLHGSGLWPPTSERHICQGKYCSLHIFLLQKPFSLNSREGWHNPDRSAVPEIVTLSGTNSPIAVPRSTLLKILTKPFPPQFGGSYWTLAGRLDHFYKIHCTEMSCPSQFEITE